MSFKPEHFRKGFPQLERRMGPSPLVYFDSAASTLKHSDVTDRMNVFNRFEASNVHRGAHQVSRQSTEFFEDARKKMQEFVNATSDVEIIFTRGTTEGINLVANVMESQVRAGDEILISPFEHHSNLVPWQRLCEKMSCQLKVIPFDSQNGITVDAFKQSLSPQTRLVAITQYSNSFGNRMPVEKVVEECRERGILTLIDAAQTVLTETIDVQKLPCDFLCFSGHKMFGPYGIGVLYGKEKILNDLPPYQSGGSMVDRVTFEKTTYANVPQKFEAGTPNITGAIGLAAVVNVIKNMPIKEAHQHVLSLRKQILAGLQTIEDCEVYNFAATDYCGVVSFNIKGTHPTDVGTLLDKYGIAVRAGHHCTQPLMNLLGIPGTVRLSLAPYNTSSEVDYFLHTLTKVKEFF